MMERKQAPATAGYVAVAVAAAGTVAGSRNLRRSRRRRSRGTFCRRPTATSETQKANN